MMKWAIDVLGTILGGYGLLFWPLLGLLVAWIIKAVGKRERLPKWPIFAGLIIGVVSTLLLAYLLASALEAEMANSN